jgi:hypothetical protein
LIEIKNGPHRRGSDLLLHSLMQEAVMPAYVVKFHKALLGDNGQVRDSCQGVINISAPSEAEAARRAREEFSRTRSTTDWTLHADSFEICPADYPS